MDIKTYLDSLTFSERKEYAVRACTTIGYLHHLAKKRKKPSGLGLILRLIEASDGNLSLIELRPDLFKSKNGTRRVQVLRDSIAA